MCAAQGARRHGRGRLSPGAVAGKFMSAGELHPRALDGASRKFRLVPYGTIARQQHNQVAGRPTRRVAGAAERPACTGPYA